MRVKSELCAVELQETLSNLLSSLILPRDQEHLLERLTKIEDQVQHLNSQARLSPASPSNLWSDDSVRATNTPPQTLKLQLPYVSCEIDQFKWAAFSVEQRADTANTGFGALGPINWTDDIFCSG